MRINYAEAIAEATEKRRADIGAADSLSKRAKIVFVHKKREPIVRENEELIKLQQQLVGIRNVMLSSRTR